MTDEEYGFLFHQAEVNLVAFKPIYLCSDELRKMVNMAIEKERKRILDVIGNNQCECRCSEVVRGQE